MRKKHWNRKSYFLLECQLKRSLNIFNPNVTWKLLLNFGANEIFRLILCFFLLTCNTAVNILIYFSILWIRIRNKFRVSFFILNKQKVGVDLTIYQWILSKFYSSRIEINFIFNPIAQYFILNNCLWNNINIYCFFTFSRIFLKESFFSIQ